MRLEEYDLGGVTDYAAFIFVQVFRNPPKGVRVGEALKGTRNHVPLGYVFILDRKFGERAKWKMPAGHTKEADFRTDDPPLATAMRELQGETGIRTSKENVRYVGKSLRPECERRGILRPAHWRILFHASVSEEERDWIGSHELENEGEMPKFFSRAAFERAVAEDGFMRDHLAMLEAHNLITLGETRDKVA